MSDVYPLRPLYRALHAARKATKVLLRDDIALATERRGSFTYPSQESVQEVWHMAEADFDLLLVDQGQELQEDGSVLYTWALVHVESGVSMALDLCWPMPQSGELEEQHARAACWSHAWRHLVSHLLAIRIGPNPAAQPWAQNKDDLPSWSSHALQSPVKVSVAAVEDYSSIRLTELCDEWAMLEAEADKSAGRPISQRDIHEAWDACIAHRNKWVEGKRPPKVGPPSSEEEKRRLFYWLLDKKAGLHA